MVGLEDGRISLAKVSAMLSSSVHMEVCWYVGVLVFFGHRLEVSVVSITIASLYGAGRFTLCVGPINRHLGTLLVIYIVETSYRLAILGSTTPELW